LVDTTWYRMINLLFAEDEQLWLPAVR